MTTDILSKYYRLPGMNVQLPTQGAFLPEGSVTFVNGNEVEVLPMRASDEMMLKNPDALMSGNAVEMLFQSCVPSITSPADISAPDMDVLLLAIRVATYGRVMEVETDCPECSAHLAFDCNLPLMLQTQVNVDPVNEVRLTDDIVVYLRPFTLRDVGELSRRVFDEERRLRLLESDETLTEDQRQPHRNALYKRMAELQSKMSSNTITKIVVPEGEVVDRAAIAGFMANTSAAWARKIDEKQFEMSKAGIDKTVPAVCEHCNHEWNTAVEFDPTTFFGQGSSE